MAAEAKILEAIAAFTWHRARLQKIYNNVAHWSSYYKIVASKKQNTQLQKSRTQRPTEAKGDKGIVAEKKKILLSTLQNLLASYNHFQNVPALVNWRKC